jgi:transketolase
MACSWSSLVLLGEEEAQRADEQQRCEGAADGRDSGRHRRRRAVGDGGAIVGMHTFGASAPLKMVVEKFGFTPDAVAEVARERVAAARGE